MATNPAPTTASITSSAPAGSGPGRVLVAGVSGVVGFAAARHFAAEGWDVVGLSRRRPARLDSPHVAVDLADRSSVESAPAAFDGVTHLVFAALYEKPGLLPGWFEADQMERNLTMLSNLTEMLADAADLQHISLLQGTKAYGVHVEPMAAPGRERNPRHRHENFYWLQEDHLKGLQQAGAPWKLTILRPQVIYGEAQGGNMNALPVLGVYAALLRQAGRALDFPGGESPLSEAVDADLLARALLWAATDQAAADETFNITNGDVYRLGNVWPVIAEAFGMGVGSDVPVSLADWLPTQEAEWARLVERFGLVAPTSLATFVGQSPIYADLLSGYGRADVRSPSLVSTVKLRQAGFAGCVDTEDMFARQIAAMQAAQLFPPKAW